MIDQLSGGNHDRTSRLWRDWVSTFAAMVAAIGVITSAVSYVLWYVTIKPNAEAISEMKLLIATVRSEGNVRDSQNMAALGELQAHSLANENAETHERELSMAQLRSEREAKTEQVRSEFRELLKAHNDQPGHPGAISRIDQMSQWQIDQDRRLDHMEHNVELEHIETMGAMSQVKERVAALESRVIPAQRQNPFPLAPSR